jgi:hypothetical protein
MSSSTVPYSFNLRLAEQEREALNAAARKLSMKPNIIVRRLVNYILEKKIRVDEMISLSNRIRREERERGIVHTAGIDADKIPLCKYRVSLEKETGVQYRAFAKEWDSSPGAIAARLTRLYLAGYIKDCELWDWRQTHAQRGHFSNT